MGQRPADSRGRTARQGCPLEKPQSRRRVVVLEPDNSYLNRPGFSGVLVVENDIVPFDRADMAQQVGIEREVRRGGNS